MEIVLIAFVITTGVVYAGRLLWQAWLLSKPEYVTRQEYLELHRCAVRLEAAGLRQAAAEVWMRLCRDEPRFAAHSECSLSRMLLTDPPPHLMPEMADVYSRLAQAQPDDGGIRFKLGLALSHLGRIEEARDAWLSAAELDDGGWRDRALEQLRATA